MKKFSAAGLFVLALLAAPETRADDGGISFGGSPHLLKGHASVAMKDEVVTMSVSEKVVKVDCTFVFHNSGPACTVRVGFPDEGQGSAEPYQGDPVPKNPKGTFITYDSWVDGKKVKTEVVPTNDRSLYWHAKTVTFKAHSDCIIRDVYTLPPGGQVTSENGVYSQTYYVLHTGASWLGPIGHAEINVTFAPDLVSKPLIVKAKNTVRKGQFNELKWSSLPERAIVFEGTSEPEVRGNTLHFVRSNFEPTSKDDIHLYYCYKQTTNMP